MSVGLGENEFVDDCKYWQRQERVGRGKAGKMYELVGGCRKGRVQVGRRRKVYGRQIG